MSFNSQLLLGLIGLQFGFKKKKKKYPFYNVAVQYTFLMRLALKLFICLVTDLVGVTNKNASTILWLNHNIHLMLMKIVAFGHCVP